MTGVELIAAERERQQVVEGWTPEHDDEYRREELVRAAICYALPEREIEGEINFGGATLSVRVNLLRYFWPWWRERRRRPSFPQRWKPSDDDRVRDLVKAGALIAAEIDRLQRRSES